jgi:hypothetical protein
MRSGEVDPVEPPTVSELEETLGQTVRECRLFAENWRNRIYRIELANGDLIRETAAHGNGCDASISE